LVLTYRIPYTHTPVPGMQLFTLTVSLVLGIHNIQPHPNCYWIFYLLAAEHLYILNLTVEFKYYKDWDLKLKKIIAVHVTSYVLMCRASWWLSETCSCLNLQKIYVVFELWYVAFYLSYIWCVAKMLAQSLSAKKQSCDAETHKISSIVFLRQRTNISHLCCHATPEYSVKFQWMFR